jgi:hypothetical protein
MWRHCLDLLAYLSNDTRRSRIRRAQYADRVHQFLDRDRRVVHLSLRDQIVQHPRRTILHLIDVDAGIEQEPLSANQARIDERKLFVASPCQRLLRIEPCPTSRCVEIELGHLRSRVSTLDQSCLATP